MPVDEVNRRIQTVIFLLTITACGNVGTDPSEDVSGTYVLERVDGTSIPTTYAGTQVLPVRCPMITDGELDLDPAGPDVRPLYSLSVVASTLCDTTDAPSSPMLIALDGGRWVTNTNKIQFDSDRHGVTTGTLGTISGVPATTLTLSGHTYEFRRVRASHYIPTPITISIVDELGASVDGANLYVRNSDGVVSRGVTNNGRSFGTGAPINGAVRIWVTPPSGFSISPTQINPLDVVTQGGQPVSIVMHLVRTGK